MPGKAPRNKTIDTPLSAGGAYLERCVTVERPLDSIEELRDRTVLGDSFAVLPLLPGACADLVIADPPYNLTKSYNGSVFAIEPPLFVELEVTETEPGFAGNTAQGATKPATVETGATIQVPLFVNIGDKVKIDTRTEEYLSRA